MKKTLLTLAVISILVSCGGNGPYSVLFQNNSSKTVSYKYQGYSDDLGPGKSKTYTVDTETTGPTDIALKPAGPISVEVYRKTEGWFFRDVTPIPVSVTNALPFTVKIKAGDYLSYKGSTELTINAGETVVNNSDIVLTGFFIYTRTPQFSVTSDLAAVTWKIEKDTRGKDIMNVTIGTP
jgi:hypothetical protein